MKKKYVNPQVEEMQLAPTTVLCASGGMGMGDPLDDYTPIIGD